MILGVLAAAPPALAEPPLAFGRGIAAGYAHSLGLRDDGTVWTWGWNAHGQLGDGTTTDRTTPVQVAGLAGITAIAAGDKHSLALREDGTVWAWGSNWSGQLGVSTAIGTAPVQVTGLTRVTAIAGGDQHTLALREDGTVWAWGSNYYGELGDGTLGNSPRSTPAQVSGLTGVTAISAGQGHSLAVRIDGTVWSWGSNWSGQLGDGTTTDQGTPVQVSDLTGITAIAAGYDHSLAVRIDGTVWSWGSNWSGQLGDGTTTDRGTPVQVSDLSGVTTIAAGYRRSLAARIDGTVWAWGAGGNSLAAQYSGLTDIIAIAAGDEHSLAVRDDGSVWAWGWNGYGQLGDGTTNSSNTPVQSQFNAGNPVPPPPPPPPGNGAPGAPVLGSPSDGAALPSDGPHGFSLTATDPDGDAYRGQIDISTSTGTPVATLLTGQVASGESASATTTTPLPEGSYRWTARAIDSRGGVSGTAPSHSFTVGTASPAPVPSADCAGGATLVDGYLGGTYVRAQARQADDDSLLVCLRADGVNVEHGGRLAFTAGAPGVPQAPSTDSAWESCRDANPAGVVIDGFVGPETPAGDGYTHLAWHQTADEAWLCLNYQGDTVRVVIPTESGGTPTVPATFTADPPGAGNPDPVAPPPGPSSTCRTSGVEHANVTTSPGHVWLGSWVESSNRAHVCVRVDGLSATGGRLTVDTSVSPGVAPVIGDETLADKPASCSARLNDTSTPNLAVYTTPAGANPGKVCVRAASASWRVITLGTSGSPSPTIPVTWAADPAA